MSKFLICTPNLSILICVWGGLFGWLVWVSLGALLCFSYSSDRLLCFLLRLILNHDPPISASQIAGIIDVSHCVCVCVCVCACVCVWCMCIYRVSSPWYDCFNISWWRSMAKPSKKQIIHYPSNSATSWVWTELRRNCYTVYIHQQH
jgi:hypothetical protein